jgi:predicted TIM-barrel fold metal-dependent hydrolase
MTFARFRRDVRDTNLRSTLVCAAALAVATLGGCNRPPKSLPIAIPKEPVIDIHTHLGGVENWPGYRPNFAEIDSAMRDRNVRLVVDFKAPDHSLRDGIYGPRVKERIAIYPDTSRYRLFANIPIEDDKKRFLAESRADYADWIASLLGDAVRDGASGLKIKQQAGGEDHAYWAYDSVGVLVPLDSRQFDKLWQTAERLRVPVLVHWGGAYKSEHMEPKGRMKEIRWEMLMLERERVLRAHPHLMFIAAHLGGSAADLPYLAEQLDRYPNLYTEGGAHGPGDELAVLDDYKKQFFDRFQNQLLFGTDYMEHTMSWLKSYRQRLDQYLPYAERWPLSDSVRAKYYHVNAEKLLRRRKENTEPIANAGYTATALVGSPVTLDATGSYDVDGDSLRYTWRQTSGDPVVLSSTSIARPTFTPRQEGSFVFELSASDGKAATRPRRVLVNAISDSGVARESGGRLTLEAEEFSQAIDRGPQRWTRATDRSGFSGRGYVRAGDQPGVVFAPGALAGAAPELRYRIWISTPGTYVVFVRGMTTDAKSATIHVGLDNEERRLTDRVGAFSSDGWGWAHDAHEYNPAIRSDDPNLAVLNIPNVGPHILNLWMSESGVMVDKIVLVRYQYSQRKFPLPNPDAGPVAVRLTR